MVLEAQDEDNTPQELVYTLVHAPRAGTLYFMNEALATGDRYSPGFREAVDVVSVQQAVIDSWDSRTWETVRDLAEGDS